MIERTGWPDYDTRGTVVAMEYSKSQSRYKKKSTGLEVIESNLLEIMMETLNT